MSEIVDKSFEGADWDRRALPTQEFPEEVLRLLGALNAMRTPGWLAAESHIRNLGAESRSNLAKLLSDLRKTLNQHPARYFLLGGEPPLFIWLQQHKQKIDWTKVSDKARATALAVKASHVIGVVADVSAEGAYFRAQSFAVQIPMEQTEENIHIYEDAARMAQPRRSVNLIKPENVDLPPKEKKPGRNDLCPCGSGVKYKKCHGR